MFTCVRGNERGARARRQTCVAYYGGNLHVPLLWETRVALCACLVLLALQQDGDVELTVISVVVVVVLVVVVV